MTQPSNNPQLERLMDGLLSGAESDRAQRDAHADPQAAAQMKLQQRIDQSLVRMFGADPLSQAQLPQRQRFVFWGWSAAAALLLAVLGVWFALGAGRSPLGPLYRSQVAAGFTPERICTTREDFATWVRDYYGQLLYPAEPHEGVEFLGWNYAPAVGQSSGVLLARVRGKEVIMVVDRKVLDKRPFNRSGDPDLNTFRHEFGHVVAYEITPWEDAAILPILSTSPDGPQR